MRVNYRKKPGVVARLKKEIKDKTDRKRAAASKAAGSIPSIKAKRKTEKMRETQREARQGKRWAEGKDKMKTQPFPYKKMGKK